MKKCILDVLGAGNSALFLSTGKSENEVVFWYTYTKYNRYQSQVPFPVSIYKCLHCDSQKGMV